MEINMLMTVCRLLEALLIDDSKKEVVKEHMEIFFVFACVWGFGSSLSVDKGVDYRKVFSEWWKATWKHVAFPDEESIYDYRIDQNTFSFVTWGASVPVYNHNPDLPFSAITVSTVDSIRQTFVMNLLAERQYHVMMCGLAGTAKSTTCREYMKSFDEDWSSCTVYMNSRTDALSLQLMMEQYIEKRAGRTYTPIGNKKHIYFLDDLNMPGFDKWTTQTPIELLFQLVDHKFLYDRNKTGVRKEIKSCQYLSAMNPTAGSFTINPRLQRHFTCIACNLPSDASIEMIYLSIFKGHLATFDQEVQLFVPTLVSATVELHGIMLKSFLPNAIKFHYMWNLRELANVFQGLMMSQPQFYRSMS